MRYIEVVAVVVSSGSLRDIDGNDTTANDSPGVK